MKEVIDLARGFPMSESTTATGKITLKDVAALAGVHPSGVSVVLNGAKSSAGVSPEARQRILEAAEALNYRPNLAARSMKSRRSMQVGALVRNNSRKSPGEILAHPMAYEMLLGISEGLEEAGYMMSFVRLSDVDEEKRFQASAFQGHLLDGLIVVSNVPLASRERLETLVPDCVWLDSNVWAEERCIRRDEVHAGRTAAQALVHLGYRRLLFLTRSSSPDSHYSLAQRRQGVKDVAVASGVRLSEWTVNWENPARLRDLLCELTPETGVIALDAYIVYSLLQALTGTDRQPGRDFALVSCDDGFHSTGLDLNWSNVSRVSFDRFVTGHQAARMMISLLDDPTSPCPSELMRGEWIEGATARPAK